MIAADPSVSSNHPLKTAPTWHVRKVVSWKCRLKAFAVNRTRVQALPLLRSLQKQDVGPDGALGGLGPFACRDLEPLQPLLQAPPYSPEPPSEVPVLHRHIIGPPPSRPRPEPAESPASPLFSATSTFAASPPRARYDRLTARSETGAWSASDIPWADQGSTSKLTCVA